MKEGTRLGKRQREVVAYLRMRWWTSPTQIGHDVWGPPHHSATASPVCIGLVKQGILERNERGYYRLAKKGERE